eukprot:g9658.t1
MTKDYALDRKLQGIKTVDRVYQGRRIRALFRGWGRLCLHAASLSAADGASAAATAITRAARAKAMEKEAEAEADKAEAWKRAAAASTKVAEAREQAQQLSAGVASLTARLERRGADDDQLMREQQLRRMKMLIARVCGERDRALIFRGWSRLCLHAASLSAAEGASASATAAARAARAEAMEKEAAAAAEKAEAWRRAAAASAAVAEAREKAQREASRGSVLTSELHQSKEEMEQVMREQQLRRMKMLITRVCGERDRALLFRGWNRLCLHAASVASAEGALASATAFAKAARAEGMEKEAESAAARAEVTPAKEEAQRACGRGSMLETQLKLKVKGSERAVRELQLRRMKMLITRACGERDRSRMFRGWSRLCLHAASLSAAEGASAAATAAARATRAEAMELEAVAAAEKIRALEAAGHTRANEGAGTGERPQRGVSSETMTEMIDRMGTLERALTTERRRRAGMVIGRVCGARYRSLMFRGWSRLCLHAASLSTAEGASAAATATARAARAEAMVKEAEAAADKAEAWKRAAAASAAAAEAREKAQRLSTGVSRLTASLERKGKDTDELMREQQLRRMKMLIDRLCGERNRALIFRGWSRLCLHAASLSAAEGASASATAAARAARAEAMEKEAAAAAEKAEAWRRAAAASAAVAEAREKAQREASRGSVLTSELHQSKEEMEQVVREQQLRRMKMLTTRVCGERDRVLLFRGWSRLCLHAASLSASEGASATASAVARAARAEALEKEAESAAATAETAAAREREQQKTDRRGILMARAKRREENVSWIARRAKTLIYRVCKEKDRRFLFRGWTRLCMHAASLNAVEAAAAASTAPARVAEAETEPTHTAKGIDRRVGAAERDARKHARRADEMEKRAVAATEQLRVLEDAGRVSLRAVEENKKLQALRLITRVVGNKDRRFLFRGWSRLCLHAASLNAAEGASAATTAAARAARAAAEQESTAAKVSAIDPVKLEASREQNLPDDELKRRRAKATIARSCRDRARVLLFRGWSRLRLHAASLSAAEGASAATTVAARAGRGERMQKQAEAADQRETSAAATDGQLKRRLDEVTAAMSVALKRAEKAEGALRAQGGQLIARVITHRDARLLFRGWSRTCMHAASLNAAEGALAAATATARANRAEAIEKEAQTTAEAAEAWRKTAAANPELAAAREQAQRQEKWENMVREQLKRRMKMTIFRLANGRNRRLLLRGWSRLCLHAAYIKAAEGVSAAVVAAARVPPTEIMEHKTITAADQSEKRDSRNQQELMAKLLIIRMCRDKAKAALFRGWSRLCLHAASLSAAEGASAAATAAARATRAEAIELEAVAPAEKIKALEAASSTCANEGAGTGERAQRGESGDTTTEMTDRMRTLERALTTERWRRAGMVVGRVCGARDRSLMFRGWSRLCIHAASLSAAEGTAASATAIARVARAEAMEKEAEAAAEKAEAWRRAAAASAAVAEAKENMQQLSSGGSSLTAEGDNSDQLMREQQLRRMRMLIARVCGERNRALMFRGWSRLCLHAASLSAAEGASASATAAARAARAEAMEKEAEAAAEKAEAWRRAAAASAAVAEAKEKTQREASRGSGLAAELHQTKEEMEQVVREQQLRRMKMLVTRVCGERDRALLFRGWSRLCLHAASLSAAEGASATATTVARAARAEALVKEAEHAAARAEAAAAREEVRRASNRGSMLETKLEVKVNDVEQVVREQKLRRMKIMIIRVCGERDRALMFRGWSRLCLHAASLSAAEGVSAATTAVARAARAEAMEKEAEVAAHNAAALEIAAAAREKAQHATDKASTLAAELERKEESTHQVAREHQQRRVKGLVVRVFGERDRALMFRGWSRLCLHAASLSAAEGASASATAAARAARAEAVEKEAAAAAEKAEAWRRAAAASAEVAKAKEKAQREAARRFVMGTELHQSKEEMEQVVRQQQLRRMKMLVTRVCGEIDRALLFRGWSRLCLHAASLSAAEGASAAATALARAARAEAMQKEAESAAARAEIAVARDELQRATARGSVLATDLKLKAEDTDQLLRRHRLSRLKTLVTRQCCEKDKSLMFRGWSRLCMHAASLSAAEGTAASATAVARAARAEAMEKEAEAAAEKAEAWRRAAAASAEVAEAKERAQQEALRGSVLTAELRQGKDEMEQVVRQQQRRRMKMLVTRVCGERDKALLFRGWSRLCLHAACLSASEGASAAATAVTRAARAVAAEKEAELVAHKAEASERAAAADAEMASARESARHARDEASTLTTELKRKEKITHQTAREHQLCRVKGLIIRVFGERDRALVFRGWSRLCLHAASLSAAEGASASATAMARAARAEAMEKEAEAAAVKAEAWRRAAVASADVAEAREKTLREAARGSVLTEELKLKEQREEHTARQQLLRRMKILITRACGETNRSLLFRGWSRLCLHAATLSAAEGASAAAMAFARAARAEAMDREAQEAAEACEAWRKAAATSADTAEARDKAEGGTNEVSTLSVKLQQKGEGTQRLAGEQRLRRMKILIVRACGEKDRSLMFRGWSRLCLHAASLSAAEGASASATAIARAARAEAMEKEAQVAADKAEAWGRAAAASAELAEAKEKAERSSEVSTLTAKLKRQADESSQMMREQRLRRMKMMIIRICGERDRALTFRAWSRLCLHAASLSAAEGASASATAVARAARAEAMEKEAEAATHKAEAWKRAAAASVEVAEAREKTQREASRGSVLTAELQQTKSEMEKVARQHQLRRIKIMIVRLCGERNRAFLFRGWSRLCLHAASLSAAEGASAAATAFARAARAEAMQKEADAAAAIAAAKAAQAKAAEREAIAAANAAAEQMEGVDLVRRRTRAIVMLQRLNADNNKRRVWRAWRSLCENTAAACAADAAIASARAESFKSQAFGGIADSNEVFSTAKNKQESRRKLLLLKTVLRFALRTERQAIIRGWERFSAATATRTASAASAERAKHMATMEAYVVDLQQKAVSRERELDRKTRALAILLRDDWATAALEREQETRAARLQLAQAEADLAAQMDSVAGVGACSSGWGVHKGQTSEQSDRHEEGGGSAGGSKRKEREATAEEAEVFLGGAGGGVGMVSLQGEGARRLRAFVVSKGRDLKRARLESQQWRARCGAMQRRITLLLNSGVPGDLSTADGNNLAKKLLDMLDERDRRLSNLYKDVASLSTAGYSDGAHPFSHNHGGRRHKARRQAGELLLRQMVAAGEEASFHIHRLSQEVQQLQTTLKVLRHPARVSEQRKSSFGQIHPRTDEFHVHTGTEHLAEATITTSYGGGDTYPTAAIDDGVQAAIDAHELIFSLRSEVSALERHAAALQANLDHLKNASAATVDQTTVNASRVAHATAKKVEGAAASAWTNFGDDSMGVEGAAVATTPAAKARLGRRKKERAERRKYAAAILQQALGGDGGGTETVMPDSVTQSGEARAVELAREARQRAEETFVSGRAAEA